MTIKEEEDEIGSSGYEAHIKISDHSLVNVIELHNGAVLSNYNYTHEQFIHALLGSFDSVSVITPLLPRGTILYSKSKLGKHFCFVEVAAQLRKILYNTAEFEDIPFPKLIVGVELFEKEKGKFNVQEVYVGSLKEGPIEEDMEVYYYPFSNVYPTFQVCWGNNIMPSLDSLVHIRSIVEMFFNSPNNDDLYGTNLSQMSYRELLKTIQGKTFPVEYLKPTGKTLMNWIKACM